MFSIFDMHKKTVALVNACVHRSLELPGKTPAVVAELGVCLCLPGGIVGAAPVAAAATRDVPDGHVEKTRAASPRSREKARIVHPAPKGGCDHRCGVAMLWID